MRTITPTTTAHRERCVVGSLLQYPGAPWGPNTSTAIAYAGAFWDDHTAGRLAQALGKCVKAGRPTTGPTVAEYLGAEDQKWLAHPSYNDTLPLDLVEVEARDLVKRYMGKRLVQLLQKAHQEAQDAPEKATTIALELRVKLEDFV